MYGTVTAGLAALAVSLVSTGVNTVFVERSNGSDRHRNSRKARKTYRFSKGWELHEAVGYFTLYNANFSCPLRTLRLEIAPKRVRQRSPARAVGLTDHAWSVEELLLFPRTKCYQLPPLSRN